MHIKVWGERGENVREGNLYREKVRHAEYFFSFFYTMHQDNKGIMVIQSVNVLS